MEHEQQHLAATEDLKLVSDPVLFGRHIAELNATNNALVRSYVWGLDLSGTMDGAGGVGGLLFFTHHGSPVTTHFCAYDGNGNVVALVNAADGTASARYEYGPFGEPIRATGLMAKENPFRFSTKRTDNTTDFVLYEYRIYIPSLGRWPSRDPLGELAFRRTGIREHSLAMARRAQRFSTHASKIGERAYGFCRNDSIVQIEFLGLCAMGRRWHERHPPPKPPLHSPKAAEQQCCRMRKIIPKGHSDFTGVEQFRFELYDIWNPPFPICSDPGPHFGDRNEIEEKLGEAVKNCLILSFSGLMHQLQDTYCHEGFKWDPCRCKFGHLWEFITGRDPDALAEENGNWQRAEDRTIYWGTKYNTNCPYEVIVGEP